MFHPDDAKYVSALPPQSNQIDKLFYIVSSNGQFSAKKAHSAITEEHVHGASLAINWHKWRASAWLEDI